MTDDCLKIETLEQAMKRIAELERALDKALDTIVRRDDALDFSERKISDLEERIESLSSGQ